MAGSFYKVAFYLLEDEAEAKDAVQEVFVKLWTTRDKLEHVLNPSAYGTMIIRNYCMDVIRKASRKKEEELRDTIEAPPDEENIAKEKLRATKEAMQQLPEVQKQILQMRVWKKMDFEDIADELGITVINVRVQLSRARKKLNDLVKASSYETN